MKLYSEGFREGQLWQAMLSCMRKAKSMHFKDLLHALSGLELNSRYTLKRFGNIPVFTVENGKKILRIEMKPFMPPRLNKNDDCYQYALIVLLFNNKGICVEHAMQTTAWTDKKEKINNQVFYFNRPKAANYYLLCLQLQGGIDGVATNTLASRGMAICTPGE